MNLRRIVIKEENKYKVTDVVEMETLTGDKVEVIKGTTLVEKDKLLEVLKNNSDEVKRISKLLSEEEIKKQINNYKEEIEGNIEMLEDHNKILNEILEEINKIEAC